MDHARFSAGLVSQSGNNGSPRQQHASHASASEDNIQAPINNHSAASPIHISSSQSSTSSTHSSSSTTHLRAFDPSDPTTLSIKPTTTQIQASTASTSRATDSGANTSTATNPSSSSSSSLTATVSDNERRGSALTQEQEQQEYNHDHEHNHDHPHDHRRPDEEDGSRRLKMSSTLMSKTVTPFLKDHIPGLYSPMTKRGTIKDMEGRNKDPNSRYCYRHRPDSKCRRAADESKMVKIQQELENLKPDDQQAITHVWSLFSAAPAKQRDLMLQGIMTQCCFPQLSKVSREILCYLDPVSLCKAAVVSKQWRALADDDQVWHRMCEQHIDRKCTKCGFGLPLLERKRLRGWTRNQQANGQLTTIDKPRIPIHAPTLPAPISLREAPSPLKRDASEFFAADDVAAAKRACTSTVASSSSAASDGSGSNASNASVNTNTNTTVSTTERDLELARALEQDRKPRAWKDVYRDRFRVGYNWRNGRCAVKVFRGHTNGVTCLQIDDVMMATGSYDATIRIWNLETGEQTRVLRGHMQGIRSLQFDDKILVSGSLDGTMKIWNWHTGELLNTLVCHQGGVISVHLDGEWLASGSTDKTIKVFNLKTKESFTLKGHSDWVNQVRIDGTASRTLFSASDDCKVKLWDLESKRCIRTFEGHVGHVQQVLTLPADFEPDEDPVASGHKDKADASSVNSGRGGSPLNTEPVLGDDEYSTRAAYGPGFLSNPNRPLPSRYILSSALDSTIKCWDTATGKCVRTFFGHLEGVWALVGDTLRVVSGANDTMVKVWEPRSGKCERTWTGHRGPVTCVGLSDSRLASGSEDGEVRLYSFQDRAGLEEYGTPS
ncbi:hypothetical protein Sste5346_006685 [Sporothrix stenoceras]|uniref:F-box domain-containing protein n=1 Tax=Sporothrix stenoceras TaxID=5173 RepID=A0ABR3YXA1_9PEZI